MCAIFLSNRRLVKFLLLPLSRSYLHIVFSFNLLFFSFEMLKENKYWLCVCAAMKENFLFSTSPDTKAARENLFILARHWNRSRLLFIFYVLLSSPRLEFPKGSGERELSITVQELLLLVSLKIPSIILLLMFYFYYTCVALDVMSASENIKNHASGCVSAWH